MSYLCPLSGLDGLLHLGFSSASVSHLITGVLREYCRFHQPNPRGRYCNASARWATPMVLAPARSAMVRDSLRIR